MNNFESKEFINRQQIYEYYYQLYYKKYKNYSKKILKNIQSNLNCLIDKDSAKNKAIENILNG